LKLLYPDPETDVPAEFLDWAAGLAVEMRRRVKEQQAFIGASEFGNVDLSFSVDDETERVVFCEESVKHRQRMQSEAEAATQGNAYDPTELPVPDPEEVKSLVDTETRDYGVGDQIGGRFEVLEVLGAGGFSRVYRVKDTVEGEERALKLFDSAAGYEAVRREISALRKVSHPHVVEVIWADRTSQGEWYLISEYVRGEPLDDYTNGKKSLRDREAVDVALDVLDALIAIHPDAVRLDELEKKKRAGELSSDEFDEMLRLQDEGLVHRDIKPQNIILTRQGAKLLDFNIASRVGDPVMTVSGTPPYQAPDVDYTRWDVSTDLFAIGVTLYELLCNGEHPYEGRRPMVGEPVRDPQQFRPDLSGAVADFLTKACAPYRVDRFATAVEMRESLNGVRANL
jgi:serine/threonine protein kinase